MELIQEKLFPSNRFRLVALSPDAKEERSAVQLIRGHYTSLATFRRKKVFSEEARCGNRGKLEGGYALHSRLPHILWLADPPTAHVLDHL